jgi:hypothetical protein
MNIRDARKVAEQVKAIPNTHGIPIQDRAEAFNRLENITKTKDRIGKTLFQVWDEDKALAMIIAEDAFENETVDFPDLEEYLHYQENTSEWQGRMVA